jgi:hypothetical protein
MAGIRPALSKGTGVSTDGALCATSEAVANGTSTAAPSSADRGMASHRGERREVPETRWREARRESTAVRMARLERVMVPLHG